MHFLFSILDQKHKQTLAFNGGVAIGNFDGKILLASATSVYRLKPVSIQIQIEVSEDIFYSLIESLQGMEFVTWSISLKFPPRIINWLTNQRAIFWIWFYEWSASSFWIYSDTFWQLAANSSAQPTLRSLLSKQLA